jgi:uncharacterized protein (DUF488 family)
MARNYQLSLPGLTPAAQAAKKRQWNRPRSIEAADFYTIGYSGHNAQTFVQRLNDADVRTLVDIRFHAFSLYKPDFNASKLKAALADQGIDYEHMPNLGVPRDIRAKAVGRTTRTAIWKWYEQEIVQRHVVRNLNWFFNVGDHPLALMCMELDPTSCHRHVLARAMERIGLRCFDL